MKALRLAGVGTAIWGLSWVWPEVNHVLTPSVMIGLILGLGAVTLAYVLIRRLDRHLDSHNAGQDHPSRPLPVAATR
jgi:4-hydroxybenzoate polyprenyltransferase